MILSLDQQLIVKELISEIDVLYIKYKTLYNALNDIVETGDDLTIDDSEAADRMGQIAKAALDAVGEK